MHSPRHQFLALVVVVLLQVPTPAAAKEEGTQVRLAFEAKPVKERFAQGEAIKFRFRLENVGDRDVLVFVPLILYFSVHLKILTPSGKFAPRCGPIPLVLWTEKDFKVLRPGEALQAEEVISCQGEEGPPEERWGYSISDPGEYAVQPTYRAVIGNNWIRTKDGNPISFYRGVLAAPAVEFTIEAPRGSLFPPGSGQYREPADKHSPWALVPLLSWLALGAVLALAVLFLTLRKLRAYLRGRQPHLENQSSEL